jgi:hypothetical protein
MYFKVHYNVIMFMGVPQTRSFALALVIKKYSFSESHKIFCSKFCNEAKNAIRVIMSVTRFVRPQ